MTAHLAVLLHAHLPFVRHPEHPVFFEEDWLFEAISESYLPLVRMFSRLENDAVPFGATLSFSATLISMLADDLLRQRYDRYIADQKALVRAEKKRAAGHSALRELACHYQQNLDLIEDTWQQLDGDLIGEIARLQREGFVDVITSGATHGYLPLLALQKDAVWAQIKSGVDAHTRAFGQPPVGMWLPECGYTPGIDQLLGQAGLRYFITETHGLLHAQPKARCGVYAPVFCPESGVAAFARDPESAQQVWSRENGYPGDPVYREFHRDISTERAAECLGRFVLPDGSKRQTGIKYYRITGPGDEKALYRPAAAQTRAMQHARDFVSKRVRHMSQIRTIISSPITVAPFDAELFGHWWHEGCVWLEFVFRSVAHLPADALRATRLSDYLKCHDTHQVAQPAQSSWGDGGYHRYWLDGSNAWVYPRLHKAAERMIDLARTAAPRNELERQALNHAARSLLLAQSSDWAFIMRSNTSVDYATKRTEGHLRDFDCITAQLESGCVDETWLNQQRQRVNLLPDLDYRIFAHCK